MDASFFAATVYTIALNLLYAIFALMIGCYAFVLLDRFIFKGIDFIEEIKAGNLAAAIFASTKLFFIAIILAVALRG